MLKLLVFSCGLASAVLTPFMLTAQTTPVEVSPRAEVIIPSECSYAKGECIDLCPDGTILSDGFDLGGTRPIDTCEGACARGAKSCATQPENRCKAFLSACEDFCYEESGSRRSEDECLDSCEHAEDSCLESLRKRAPKDEKARVKDPAQ